MRSGWRSKIRFQEATGLHGYPKFLNSRSIHIGVNEIGKKNCSGIILMDIGITLSTPKTIYKKHPFHKNKFYNLISVDSIYNLIIMM